MSSDAAALPSTEAPPSLLAAVRRILLHPVFLLCLLAALSVVAYMILRGHNTRPIGSDGFGYYLPLPATFIYRDLSLSFLNDPDLARGVAQYRFRDGHFQGLAPAGGGYLDKYALGTAVMQLPFFLAALAYASLAHPHVSGFELAFQLAMSLSGAFYLALGCTLTYLGARLRYSPVASALAVAFALLGTNLLYYGSFEGSFSHVYGFCLISGLLYLTVRRTELGGAPHLWEFALFGFLAGIAVMVRPTNAVAALLFIPFARNAGAHRIATGTLLGFAASVVGALPQMLLWYKTTGLPIFYSYVGEGFRFLEPQLSRYLFSVTKGVFFWHPAYLVMILALVARLAVRRFETAIMLLIVALNIYLGASWSDPSFGDSFGCRQIVEINPLLILPTAAAIDRLPTRAWRRAAAVVGGLLVLVNMIQFRGYMVGALPHNKATLAQYEKFWAGWGLNH